MAGRNGSLPSRRLLGNGSSRACISELPRPGPGGSLRPRGAPLPQDPIMMARSTLHRPSFEICDPFIIIIYVVIERSD